MVVALAAGTLIGRFVDNAVLFIALSIVALIGMGFGNVVGALLVKKYFPDQQRTGRQPRRRYSRRSCKRGRRNGRIAWRRLNRPGFEGGSNI